MTRPPYILALVTVVLLMFNKKCILAEEDTYLDAYRTREGDMDDKSDQFSSGYQSGPSGYPSGPSGPSGYPSGPPPGFGAQPQYGPPPPRFNYGPPPPNPNYGPPNGAAAPYPVYGPPSPPPPQPSYGIPYGMLGILDKLKFKLDLFILGKILLKLVIFKKIVSLIAILCLLLFIPSLKHKIQDHDSNGGGGGVGRTIGPKKYYKDEDDVTGTLSRIEEFSQKYNKSRKIHKKASP